MGRHVIIGAGAVGTATALALVDRGHEVTMVTRSGSGPERPGITRVAADASDPFALATAVGRADALYNCANPPYHRWPELWPPMASSMLEVAHGRRRGARHHGQPLRLRARRPSDDRGRPPGLDRHQGPDPDRHVGGRPGRPPGRPGPGHRGPGVGLLRPRRGRDQLLRAQCRPPAGRPEGPAPRRPRRAALVDLRPRRRTHAGRAGHRRAGVGAAVARADRAGADPAPDGHPLLPGGRCADTAGGVLSGGHPDGGRTGSRPRCASSRRPGTSSTGPFVLDSSACTATFGIEATPLDEALADVADHARRRSVVAGPPDDQAGPAHGDGRGQPRPLAPPASLGSGPRMEAPLRIRTRPTAGPCSAGPARPRSIAVLAAVPGRLLGGGHSGLGHRAGRHARPRPVRSAMSSARPRSPRSSWSPALPRRRSRSRSTGHPRSATSPSPPRPDGRWAFVVTQSTPPGRSPTQCAHPHRPRHAAGAVPDRPARTRGHPARWWSCTTVARSSPPSGTTIVPVDVATRAVGNRSTSGRAGRCPAWRSARPRRSSTSWSLTGWCRSTPPPPPPAPRSPPVSPCRRSRPPTGW